MRDYKQTISLKFFFLENKQLSKNATSLLPYMFHCLSSISAAAAVAVVAVAASSPQNSLPQRFL